MFTVYPLYSPSSDKLYVGYTSDIQQRLLSHNQLAKKGFSVKYRPWELFYTEEFEGKQDESEEKTLLDMTLILSLFSSQGLVFGVIDWERS